MRCCRRCVPAVFGLDVRSLACFRMAVAFTSIHVTMLRFADVDAFLSDRGVMPRSVKLISDPGSAWALNLHFVSGHATVLSLLILAHAALLVCMFVGYKTRAVSIVLFVLELSLQNRNHLVLQGGDNVIRVAHCFACFLPIGEVWSIDAWLRTRSATRRNKRLRRSAAATVGSERFASNERNSPICSKAGDRTSHAVMETAPPASVSPNSGQSRYFLLPCICRGITKLNSIF